MVARMVRVPQDLLLDWQAKTAHGSRLLQKMPAVCPQFFFPLSSLGIARPVMQLTVPELQT
jgi:hypothetical protein